MSEGKLDQSTGYCSICLSREELLDEEVSKLIEKKVPSVTALYQLRTNRICLGCVQRFVRFVFVKGKVRVKFEELQEMLRNKGESAKFEDVIRAAAMLGLRAKMRIKRVEWRRQRKQMIYREAKNLRDKDAADRRYEEFEKIRRQQEELRLRREENVLEEMRKCFKSARLESNIEKLLKQKMEGFEYDFRALGPIKSETIERYERENPCKVCKEVVCPSDCEQLKLFKWGKEVWKIYGL